VTLAGLTWFMLLQTVAILYLIYRVHRLEERIGTGGRPARRTPSTEGDSKVIPLLRDRVPVGPFGKGDHPPTDPPK